MQNKLNSTLYRKHICFAKRQTGFSLLEILVAFAILALSIGVLLNIFSRGLRTAIVSEEYQTALVIAESQLATVGIETPLAVGVSSGQIYSKYNWSVQSSLFIAQNTKGDAPPAEVVPYNIEVRVEWQDGVDTKAIVLNTLRLAKPQL